MCCCSCRHKNKGQDKQSQEHSIRQDSQYEERNRKDDNEGKRDRCKKYCQGMIIPFAGIIFGPPGIDIVGNHGPYQSKRHKH